ncbi:MAG: DUF4349 domain-containing protein [Thermoleophilaceae bacterium]|nr:DUF4349 domain-containing protein [Thermoleophilaceae bacterium]
MILPEPVPPPGEDFADGERQRRVERSASITLAAGEDDIGKAAAGIARVAEQRKGYIVSSDLSTGEDGASGSFELRVPARELIAAMADLGDLATVESRTQRSQDVTQGFVTAQDRLDRARAERKSLLRRLERADSGNEARSLRRQLDLASAEVRRLQGEIRRLGERTAFASISVTLEKDGGSGASPGGVQEGLDDLTGSLLESVNIALRLLGLLIPVGLLVLLFWTTYRWSARHRTG